MKLRNNLILLIALIIFAVLVFLLEKPFEDKSKKAREEAGPLFSELQIDKVKKIQVKKGGDTIVSLIYRDNAWFVVGDEEYPADQGLVKEALDKIQKIQRINLASRKKDKHAMFEVAPGIATEVILFGPDEKEMAHLMIGKSGPDLFSTYVRSADSDDVFLNEEHLQGQFNREVNNWRDKQIFDFDPNGATELEIAKKEETIILSKDTEQNWHLEQPVSSLAEKAEVEKILRALASLRAADFASKEETKESGIDQPTCQISVELKDGQKKTLLIGNSKGEHQYYAKNEEKKYIYVLYKSTVDNLTPEIKTLEKVEIEPEEEKAESRTEKDASSSAPPLPPVNPSSPLAR